MFFFKKKYIITKFLNACTYRNFFFPLVIASLVMVQSLRKRDKLMEVGGVSNFIGACQFLISDTWNSRAYFVGQRIWTPNNNSLNATYTKGYAIYFLSSLLTDFSMRLNQVIPTFLHFSCMFCMPFAIGQLGMDWDPMQYLGYCTGCNSSNFSPWYNLMATLNWHVIDTCQFFFSLRFSPFSSSL